MRTEDILKKYSRKIEQQIGDFDLNEQEREGASREYMQFKQEMMPSLSRYEKWSQSLGNIIKCL